LPLHRKDEQRKLSQLQKYTEKMEKKRIKIFKRGTKRAGRICII